MKYSKCFLFLSFLVFALVFQISCSNRQEPKTTRNERILIDPRFGSTIYGEVTDDRGAPLPGVSITLESNNVPAMSGTSDVRGAFSFRGLPTGKYAVYFSIEGFTEVRQEEINVQGGSMVQLAIILKPSLSEEFTVIGETPMIDTRKTGITETYRPREGFDRPRKSRKMQKTPAIPPSAPAPAETETVSGTYGISTTPPEVPPELVIVARNDEWMAPPTQQAKREPGRLEARSLQGDVLPVNEFPLQRTVVDAQADGFLARTILKQEYTNPYSEVIEAVYVFPLPSLAAVNGFEMEAHGRRIIGIVREREEAEEIYREALQQGMTASLLTQERPNVFTQSIANVEPGGNVSITITYVERLAYENGFYEYVFPMSVAERYGSSQVCSSESHSASGASGYLPDPAEAVRSVFAYDRHGVDLTVQLDAGLPVQSLSSATHEIEVTEEGPANRTVRLASQTFADRDFVLRWSVAAGETQFGSLAHRSEEDGYFTLMIQPPLEPADAYVTPREITFIMDVSGSMSGLPIETSRELVTRSIDKLRAYDIFNIVYFAGGNGQLWDAPRAPTSENLVQAWDFLKSVQGSGGTEMMAGLQRALSAKHEPQYLQMYVFLTDGFVSEDKSILAAIRENKGAARFFAFGIGDSVNRFLIDGIGELGGGYAQTVIPQDRNHGQRAVEQFFAAIDSPVLVDVSIDWNGLPVSDVYPKRPNDLFAGQTISLVGKYSAGSSGRIYVNGRIGERPVRYEVQLVLPEREQNHESLAFLWGRQKIHELGKTLLIAEEAKRAEIVSRITGVALKYRLVSDYTAFVAVDESQIVGGGKPLRVSNPLPVP